ncbi:MAG: hypothetical protein WKF90_13010 [Pyrinomonadaceae bacterium]|jgi:hypothetical protein
MTASKMNIKKLFLLVVILPIISSCDFLKECSDEHLEKIASPDGKYVAAQFRRGCGATTPFVYHINLRESSKEFSYNLNGAMYEGEVFDINNQKVNLIWKDDKTLRIECESCPVSQATNLENTWKDIQILYQPNQKLK